jgi:cytochrome c biogenesis protein CcmG/thiol:disulfide interchange protein DsbE
MMDKVRRALVAGLSASVLPLGAARAGAKVGAPASSFRVTTFDRKWITSAELKGEVILLNFWATWCAPCRVELPLLDAFARRHAGDGLRMFAVNDHNVPDSRLKPLAAALSFPLVIKIQGSGYQPIDGAYPSNFIIDRQGILRWAKAGAFNERLLEQELTPLLKEPKPEIAPPAVS